MADLAQFEETLEQLLAGIDEGGRRRLARKIGAALRRSQAQRIASQRNPDGSAYEPRKLRTKTGRIKRQAKAGPMFRKLRQARFLQVEASEAEVSVGYFAATVARVAAVHHYGLRDRVSRDRGSPEVTYARRELVGFTSDERARILELAIEHLGDA